MPNSLDIDCIAVGSALIWHPGTICWPAWGGGGGVVVVRAGSVFELSAGIVFANMVRYING